MRRHVLVSMLLSAAILAGGAAAAYWLITHRPPAEHHPLSQTRPEVLAPPVAVHPEYRVVVTGYGSARPRIKIQITPEVSGRVDQKAANYLAGRYVTDGQMLFQIEKTDYQQAFDSAQRNIELLDARLRLLNQEQVNLEALEKNESDRVELARQLLERTRKLRDRGASTETEVDDARELLLGRQQQLQNVLNQKAIIGPQREQLKAERRVAEVARDKAQTALRRTLVASPVRGRVLSCQVEVGERVQAGTPCGELYGMEIMEVPVSVAASDLQWIDRSLLTGCREVGSPGRRIPAKVHWEEPGTGRIFTWDGCVSRVEAGLEALTRTATLVVEVINAAPGTTAPAASASDDQPMLDINMFCRVTIFGRTERQVIILPRQAIQPDNTVFLVDAEHRLRRRAVKVARFADEQAMILTGEDAGIKQGDRVAINYIPKPVVGMLVRPTGPAPASSPAKPAPPGEGQ